MRKQTQPTLRIAIHVVLNGAEIQHEAKMAQMQAAQPGRLWAEPAPQETVNPPTLAYCSETYLVMRECVRL
jgi:hypothetical protein